VSGDTVAGEQQQPGLLFLNGCFNTYEMQLATTSTAGWGAWKSAVACVRSAPGSAATPMISWRKLAARRSLIAAAPGNRRPCR
jgi:hypothetical protein